jgi:hypothetical protein
MNVPQGAETVGSDAIFRLLAAIKRAFDYDTRETTHGFVLLYATMDIVSSLSRPISQEDTSGKIFQTWVGEYMLKGSKLHCTAQDIWGARCGILHTMSLNSRQARKYGARQIAFVTPSDGVDRMQAKIDAKGTHNTIVVCLEDYIEAFFDAVSRFLQQVQSDAHLRERVLHHMSAFPEQLRFKFAT